ncbi:UNVERIFIED_CONTAM: hypothetical protein GTU68_060395 [Idotea baltica]|nr:hypothetical protein [Idotea baltica]
MQRLYKKRILVGVGGGIAAYKSAELIRTLKKVGAEVRVVMTANSLAFITPLTLQALSGNPVHHELLDTSTEAAMNHIELARWADFILIAPATANLMARIAQGAANDLLTTLVLATKAPTAIAPAMNHVMWHNSATQENLSKLTQRGITCFGPTQGDQACGEVGLGRLLEPSLLVQFLADSFTSSHLEGLHVLVTAGPTQENIDPVRYITNHSSGKMGFSVAEAAVNAGAKVTLISGPTALLTPHKVTQINVTTAREMLAACESAMPCDIFIATAAVADYRPQMIAPHKLKKTTNKQDSLKLEMIRNPDILATLAQREDRPFSVGFAAETQHIQKYALHKLIDKNLDLIVANDVANPAIGFNSEENAITIFDRSQQKYSIEQASKTQIARQLIEFIAHRIKQ